MEKLGRKYILAKIARPIALDVLRLREVRAKSKAITNKCDE